MAGGASTGDDDAIYNINVTPLVDITLVLLIIMMVTARIIVNQGMPMELPSEKAPDPANPEVQEFLTVNLTADGKTVVNDTPIKSELQLIDVTKRSLKQDKDIRAVIRAESTVKHGKVVRMLDILKRTGVQRIGFQPPEEQQGAKTQGETPEAEAQ